MRELYNEMENKKTREEIKNQSERGIEMAKLLFDNIQVEMRRLLNNAVNSESN